MHILRIGWLAVLLSPPCLAQTATVQQPVDHVQVAPAANQTVQQPAGTAFTINNNGAASVSFTDPLSYHIPNQYLSPGVLSQEKISGYTPNIFNYNLWTPKFTCAGPGQDLSGNWSGCKLLNYEFTVTQRGIAQKSNGMMASYGIGDKAIDYDYATFFGGLQVFSDEGITAHATHATQNGYLSGHVTQGGEGVGVIKADVTCHSTGEGCNITTGNYFNDGGIVYDQSQGRSAKIVSKGSAMNGLYLDVSGIDMPQSTAWGNIVSCKNNGPGQYQLYTSTTCKIKLGTEPKSPGAFIAGQDIYLSGPFEEEAYVTAVAPAASEIQEVTFNTRYYWNIGVPAIVMQGGPGGKAIVQNQAWPIAWFVVGAFSRSRIVYSNCHMGYCNSSTMTGVTPLTPMKNSFQSSGAIVRSKNLVTFTYVASNSDIENIYRYPKGSTVVLSGWMPADLNGTYTVTYNSMDADVPSIQWIQNGVDETSSGVGTISEPLVDASIYPAAFITGTDGGKIGVAQLGTNRVNFGARPSGRWEASTSYAVGYTLLDSNGYEQIVTKAGVSGTTEPAWRDAAGNVADGEVVWTYAGAISADVVVGAPSSEYEQVGVQYYGGQASPSDPGSPSRGISVFDQGPSQMTNQYEGINDPRHGVGFNMFNITGSFKNVFRMQYRPANNGTILYVAGDEPVSENPKPYYLFQDNLSFAAIEVKPRSSSAFVMSGGLTVRHGSLHVDSRYGGFFLDGLTPGTAALCLNGPGGQMTNIGCATAVSRTSPIVVQAGTGQAGNAIEVQNHEGKVVADIDSAGNVAGASGTFHGAVQAGEYVGPAAAPTGSCSRNGAWVFSQDGHATFCANGKWVSKL